MGKVKHWLAAKTSAQRLNLFASMHIGVSLPMGTERAIVCQKVRCMSSAFVRYHPNPKGIGFSHSLSIIQRCIFNEVVQCLAHLRIVPDLLGNIFFFGSRPLKPFSEYI